MSDLVLHDSELIEMLYRIAEHEKRSVEEILKTMAANYQPSESKELPDPNPLLKMAEMAREANLTFVENNVVERSREILDTELADELLKRIQSGDE